MPHPHLKTGYLMRIDSRKLDQLRPVTFSTGYVDYPEGSVLISVGKTRVLCNVTIEDMVPRWMQQKNVPGGWITAEYAMLPRATHERTRRETLYPSSRTQEIRRLVGRALRSGFDLTKLGPRTLTVDCDVLQADGGTRTASITGGYVALALALHPLVKSGKIHTSALLSPVAAVSVGLVDGQPMLDLCYTEDSQAGVDANVVMNAEGEYIEVQGTAEGKPFARPVLDQLLTLAWQGITELITLQQDTLRQCGIS